MLWCFLMDQSAGQFWASKFPLSKVSIYSSGAFPAGTRQTLLWLDPMGCPAFRGCTVAQSWAVGFSPHSQPCVWHLLLTLVYMYPTPTRVYPTLPSLIHFLFSHKRKLELSLPYLAAEGSWPTVPGVRDVGGVSQTWEPAHYLSTAERRLGAGPIFF